MVAEREERQAWFRREVLPLEASLRAYGARFCRGSSDQVEDLLQDTFAKLLGYESWRTIDNVPAFSVRVLKNIALDAVRRRKIVAIDAVADLDRVDMVDEIPGADRIVAGRDELRALARVIAELPTQCRRVFTLRKVYGLSHAEIAVRLGLSVSTVEKHVIKGLRHCSDGLSRGELRVSSPNLESRWTLKRDAKR